MNEKCSWIVFHAYSTAMAELEDRHPDFFGVFICPELRPEPEQLLSEVLTNRKLILAEIDDRRAADTRLDWGMHERLKAQIEEQGYGISVTKMQPRPSSFDE